MIRDDDPFKALPADRREFLKGAGLGAVAGASFGVGTFHFVGWIVDFGRAAPRPSGSGCLLPLARQDDYLQFFAHVCRRRHGKTVHVRHVDVSD